MRCSSTLRSSWTCAGLALALAACGRDSAPTWQPLSDLGVRAVERSVSTPELTYQHDHGWLRVTQAIAPQDWLPGPFPGVVTTSLAIEGSARSIEPGIPHDLVSSVADVTFKSMEFSPALLDTSTFEAGMYAIVGSELYLVDPEGAISAAPLRYVGSFPLAESARFTLGGVTSNGWLISPDESITAELPDMGGAAELHFSVRAYGSEALTGPTTYALTLDGTVVHRETLSPQVFGHLQTRRIDLEGAGTLAVHVEAGRALLALGSPRLLPAAAEPDPRPDLVLFVADTFRADNMALYGGDPAWTPRLDAWSQGGLAFEAARATAPWTLPSHTSMLTGLYPFQHGAISNVTRIAPEIETIAERLNAAGYRTVAVTDGIYLTESHGFTQGFETFMQYLPSKEFEATTLDALDALLAEDDGRPLFLYVQTYYTHTPYEVLPATRARLTALFDPAEPESEWDWQLQQDRLQPEVEKFVENPKPSPAGEDALAKIEALYRGGAHDFDAHFGKVLDVFDASSYDPIVVFTSDHGEAFAEHDSIYHGDSVYDEEVHVPLVVRGPGITPGKRSELVSLVDLAPTFAHLADVPPAPGWIGESLLDPARKGGPIGSFSTNQTGIIPEKPYAIFDGHRKVIELSNEGVPMNAVEHAFDLADDPGETEDLAAEAWPEHVVRELRAHIDDWFTARTKASLIELTEADLKNLEAMGYFGK